jgi:transcriptional regulator with XRE-family HTH domain
MSVARNIAQLRERSGLTQQQLADRVGVTREYISMIEHGKRQINRYPLLARFAEALEVNLAMLCELGRDGDDGTTAMDLRDVHADLVADRDGAMLLVITDGYSRIELSGGLAGRGQQAKRGAERIRDAAGRYAMDE